MEEKPEMLDFVKAMSDADRLRIIGALVKGGASGDSLVITFSGHGTYAPDKNGDEPDGLDEGLCPYDIKQGKVLIDDEIHQLFAQRAAGVRIVLISDSCHSGTVIRAPASDPDAAYPPPGLIPVGGWVPGPVRGHGPPPRLPRRVTERPEKDS